MLGLIALFYLLLAVRVRICFDASLSRTDGCLTVIAGAAGFQLRFDGEIMQTEGGMPVKIAPRYGRKRRKAQKDSRKSLRRVRRMLWFAETGHMEQLSLHARIGLGDAAETALAAGGLRALASAAFFRYGGGAECDLSVVPDFDTPRFAAHGCCIFSCQAGDIMLAVLKAAARKIGKEGFWWKSTPLKA